MSTISYYSKSLILIVQFTLSPDLMEKTTFTKWMELLSMVLCNPVPAEADRCDIIERDQLPWWKVKKWTLHIMYRIFER